MSPREVLEEWIRAFNRQDARALADLYAVDAVNHQMPSEPLVGRNAILESFVAAFSAVPDMGFEVVNVMVDGEWAALEWDGWGTVHADSGENPERPYRLRGCGFFRVHEGKIVWQRGYWDSETMRRQTGVAV